MLTFSPAQQKTFHTRWQIDRLQAQLPGVLAQLAENHPEFYARNEDSQHQQHGNKRIEQAVSHGYTDIEHIQQLLDLEYQAQLNIYQQNPIQALYQADWLEPQDRINGIQTLLTQKNTNKDRKNHLHDSAYQSLDEYPLEKRGHDIAALITQVYTDNAQASVMQMLRQALYHALLKDKLQKASGWQAWRSDGQQAQIGIEHPGHQRRIRLQPTNSQTVQAELDDHQEDTEKTPLLILHVPDQLDAGQHTRLKDILHAWVYDLLPAAPLRARFIPPADNGPPSQTSS